MVLSSVFAMSSPWVNGGDYGVPRSVGLVQFSPDLREPVLSGSITLTYRLWTRPKVKVGGRYRVESGWIAVDDVELVPFGSVTDADVRRCGEVDREQLRARTAHAGPVHDDTLVYRIEFHAVAER
jgi:hypothetical protein